MCTSVRRKSLEALSKIDLARAVRGLRKKHGSSQEDMICFGFSARHWQQVEAGRPIIVTTLLRICEVFDVLMAP
jgi:hypothetical protein